jgi:cytochrome c oxidase subunit 2
VPAADQPTAPAADLAKLSPEQRGERLFKDKMCATCHALDGNRVVGPALNGVLGRQVKLTDGSTITADEAYITESIKNPTAKVVEGFPPAMPPLGLNDSEIQDLIAYLKTVK